MVEITQGNPRAERSDALANRQRILDAAREIFARRGMNAEVREIAEKAGVGIGTIYRHFKNREDLLEALVNKAKEDIMQAMQEVVAIDEPRAALRAMIHKGAEYCERFGSLSEVLLTSGKDELHLGCHGEVQVNSLDQTNDFKDLLTTLLRRGIDDGTFRANLDISVAIAALESIFVSGMLLALAARRSFPQAADAVADFFLKAIETPKSV